jgi:dihydrofolate reductase
MYSSFINYVDFALVTKVDADGEGTIFFPNLDENPDFELTWTSDPCQDGEYTLTFNTYERIKD